jgi:hypothetical protein
VRGLAVPPVVEAVSQTGTPEIVKVASLAIVLTA